MTAPTVDEMGPTWVSNTPMGRLSQPEDLQGAAVFLASPATRYKDVQEGIRKNDHQTIKLAACVACRVCAARRGLRDEAEREIVEKALLRTGGNKSQAAQTLSITRKSLYRRMKKYGLT